MTEVVEILTVTNGNALSIDGDDIWLVLKIESSRDNIQLPV